MLSGNIDTCGLSGFPNEATVCPLYGVVSYCLVLLDTKHTTPGQIRPPTPKSPILASRLSLPSSPYSIIISTPTQPNQPTPNRKPNANLGRPKSRLAGHTGWEKNTALLIQDPTRIWTARAKADLFPDCGRITAQIIKAKSHNTKSSWKATRTFLDVSKRSSREEVCEPGFNDDSFQWILAVQCR
jgi:hypothetical protein